MNINSRLAQPKVNAFGPGLKVQADADSGFGSLIRLEGRALEDQGLSLDFGGERFEVRGAPAPDMAEALAVKLQARGFRARVWKNGGADLRAGVFVDSVQSPAMGGVAAEFAQVPAAPRGLSPISVRFV